MEGPARDIARARNDHEITRLRDRLGREDHLRELLKPLAQTLDRIVAARRLGLEEVAAQHKADGRIRRIACEQTSHVVVVRETAKRPDD